MSSKKKLYHFKILLINYLKYLDCSKIKITGTNCAENYCFKRVKGE